MSIRKRETPGVIVIARRIIHDLPTIRFVGIARHVHNKIAVVDAVFALVQEDPSLRRTGIVHICGFVIDRPLIRSASDIERTGSRPAWAAYPVIHGHAAGTWNTFLLRINPGSFVGWTFPDAQ